MTSESDHLLVRVRLAAAQPDSVMDDIVKDFLIESRENLDRLDQELVSLESDPGSKELLSSIFRTIHTIKGSCGFLGFAHLEKIAHAGENLLSKLRDDALSLNADITSALLALVDAVRRMLNEIQASESDGKNEYSELLARLENLLDGMPGCPSRPIEIPPVNSTVSENVRATPDAKGDAGRMQPAAEAQAVPTGAPPSPVTQIAASADRPAPSKIGSLLVERGCVQPEDLSVAIRKQQEGDRRRLGDILVAMGACTQQDVDATKQILEASERSAALETVHVRVDLLDKLMNLVGELVLARNQLLQVFSGSEDDALQSASQRVSLIVSEVQEEVIKTRMQPIGNVWNKFPRTVRDLALSCGKEVRLAMEGQETELDRTITEAIRDPLTHLVRNAIDHGIEMPEIRRKAGKDAAGLLCLRACQQGGNITVEVSDDGAGLDVERLCNKAIERGVITPRQAKRMSEREIFNLIFLPGFSTAEKVTNVSGRGVGMDVVKTNVEKISGAIDIESIAGKGTTVRVKIPLTLAIIPALIVTCQNERFTIPQVSVLEVVPFDVSGSGPQVETIHGHPVYRLRGNLLPLVYLQRELQLVNADSPPSSSAANIVVLQADTRQFGLVVDGVLDTEEIVVKPLGEHLKGINIYSGATIMGDGRVALILDVLGLAERAGVIRGSTERLAQSYAREIPPRTSSDRQTLLLARNGPEVQVGIPLSAVARLESLPENLVRHIGHREMMEYRGQVTPMLRLSKILSNPDTDQHRAPGGSIDVIMYAEHGRTVGVIVDCIIDIIEMYPEVDRLAARTGVVGSFISDHHIVELLDLPTIVRTAFPEIATAAETSSAKL